MVFYYKNEYWDTDKLVYIMGYGYESRGSSSWYAVKKKEIVLGYAKLKCKQGIIKSVHFDYNFGQSFVTGFTVEITSAGKSLYEEYQSGDVIVSHSHVKARKMYENSLHK